MAATVVIVDDHKILRDGLKAILRFGDEFEVVGESDNGSEAILLVRKLKPDIVLMDVFINGLNGIEATVDILRTAPSTRIVILSMYDDENTVISAVRSGARAFVLKKASDNDLLVALRTVAAGGFYLSPQVSDRLVTRIQRGDLESKQVPSALEGLSPRELQVLRMVAAGGMKNGWTPQ